MVTRQQASLDMMHSGLHTLSKARAGELVAELGFLGIVDLLTVLASGMDGGLDLESDRLVVKVRTRQAALARQKRRKAK